MTKYDKIVNYIYTNPEATTKDISIALSVSKRHVRRAKNKYQLNIPKSNRLPKILLIDIETLPMEVLVWGLYKQRIPYENKIKNWSIVCWCAKWLYSSEIMGEKVHGYWSKSRIDGPILNGIHNLLNEADIVIAHNGSKFDIPKLNTRFIYNGYPPNTPYQIIDTYKVARKYLSFSSSSLDAIAEVLNLKRKQKSSYDWWYKAAVNGSQIAIDTMFDYCKQDINVLEDVYTALRPWIKSHPNLGLYMDTDKSVCSNCGSDKLKWNGHYYTSVNRYESFQCSNCGAIGRKRSSDVDNDKRKVLIAPTAR